VNLPASVEGSERLRLFCALRLPDETTGELASWQAEAFGDVPDVRPSPRDHLHVTLAFLGHRPVEELDQIIGALRDASRPSCRSAATVKRGASACSHSTTKAVARRRWRPTCTGAWRRSASTSPSGGSGFRT